MWTLYAMLSVLKDLKHVHTHQSIGNRTNRSDSELWNAMARDGDKGVSPVRRCRYDASNWINKVLHRKRRNERRECGGREERRRMRLCEEAHTALILGQEKIYFCNIPPLRKMLHLYLASLVSPGKFRAPGLLHWGLHNPSLRILIPRFFST